MESITLRDIHDLPGDQKHSLEVLLKHPLEEGERVFIMTFRPGIVPDEAARRSSQAVLLEILDEADRHAREQGVTGEEADAAVEEAMQQLRSPTS